jgi:hypothetical protein
MTENSPDPDQRTVEEVIDEADPAGSPLRDSARNLRNLLAFVAWLAMALWILFESCFAN